jgi:AcrR family transcriptional regulator
VLVKEHLELGPGGLFGTRMQYGLSDGFKRSLNIGGDDDGEGNRMSAAGTRQPQAGDTRAALVNGALATLQEAGFAGASARQIARRAGCNQALIFYHFGSVHDLLIAALEHVSAQRMAAYRTLLDHQGTLTDLADAARVIFTQDLDAGHVTVLAEMISGAQSTPDLGPRVSACLSPWREVTESLARRVIARLPIAPPLPPEHIAHGVMAGILGLELLASLDGDRTRALELFDHARSLASLLDQSQPLLALLNLAGAGLPAGPRKKTGGS